MPLKGHTKPVSGAMFSGVKDVVTWSEDGTARRWDVDAKDLLGMLRQATSICMEPSRRRDLSGNRRSYRTSAGEIAAGVGALKWTIVRAG